MSWANKFDDESFYSNKTNQSQAIIGTYKRRRLETDSTKEGDKILSITKILKNNNFIFKCKIIEDCCSHETTLHFLDTIKNKLFCEDVKNEENDEKEFEDDDENEKVSPSHLVKLIGRIIQNIIKNNSYVIEKEYDIKNGIKIIFDHDFLGCRYILNLKSEHFRKKYVNLENNELSSVVLRLLNENETLKKKIENQFCYEEISRIQFIESGLWTKSPFDIPYSKSDILDGNGNIKRWVFQRFEHPDPKDKFNITQMLKLSRIQPSNNKNNIFDDNVDSVITGSGSDSNKKFVSIYKDIVLNYSKIDGLSLRKENNEFYLRGNLFIKVNGMGSILKTRKQNVSSNRQKPVYSDLITLDSVNNFLFNKKHYVIGKVNDLKFKRNMKSKYFIVSYNFIRSPTTGFGIRRDQHNIKALYQIKLNGGILTIHFLKAYQNSNNTECKDGYSGTVNESPNLGIHNHTQYMFNLGSVNAYAPLNLQLYNN